MITRKKMTGAEVFALGTLLNRNVAKWRETQLSLVSMAKEASKELGRKVTEANMETAFKATGNIMWAAKSKSVIHNLFDKVKELETRLCEIEQRTTLKEPY